MNSGLLRRGPAPRAGRNLVQLFAAVNSWLFLGLSAVLGGVAFFLPVTDWRLMCTAFSAAAFNAFVLSLALNRWREGTAVLGLVLNSLMQGVFLGTICVPGGLDYLWFYSPYTVLIGREPFIFLGLTVVSFATLFVMTPHLFMQRGRAAPAAVASAQSEIGDDPRLPWLLGFGAVFTLFFWVGTLFEFGLLKAIFQVVQRAFLLVPFLAGFHYRRMRWSTVLWFAVLLINLGLGVATGSRGPAFLPAIFYVLGLVLGVTGVHRVLLYGALVLLALPGAYVFGMIEVIRTDVGRLNLSDLSSDKLGQVASRMVQRSASSRDDYEELPAWVRTNVRVVTWPTLVVCVVANSPGNQRGFADLPDQLMASLNIVALTGRATSYYNEGLFNLRASDYGFRVDEGTSVEFGLVAESWDRGGFLAALGYSVLAVLALWLSELALRRFMHRSPALKGIALSVVFSTAFLTLNGYNLPLSLRHMAVNLIVCLFVFGAVNLLAGGVAKLKPREAARATAAPERRSRARL